MQRLLRAAAETPRDAAGSVLKIARIADTAARAFGVSIEPIERIRICAGREPKPTMLMKGPLPDDSAALGRAQKSLDLISRHRAERIKEIGHETESLAERLPCPPPHRLVSQVGFFDFREALSAAILAGKVEPSPEALFDHSVARFGLDICSAAEWTERFFTTLQHQLDRSDHEGTRDGV